MSQLDAVKVDSSSFRSLLFMGAEERKEFALKQLASDKAQRRTAAGVPLWSVKIAAIDWRDSTKLLTVSVPMDTSPAERFVAGQPIQLIGLVFGVTGKRGGGFLTWASADEIQEGRG